MVSGSASDSQRPLNIPVLVTSRMSSQRMPGKALHLISGRPLLEWVVSACQASRRASGIVVATSADALDEPIREWCRNQEIRFREGPLDDVLGRILGIAEMMCCDAVVRISGDSPLMDPVLIDYAIDLYCSGDFDLVTNVETRTFPRGQSVEVIRTGLLRELAQQALPSPYREHVTPAIYRGLVAAQMRNFTSQEVDVASAFRFSADKVDLPSVNLSVDTPKDVKCVEGVIRFLRPLLPSDAGWVACTQALLVSESVN